MKSKLKLILGIIVAATLVGCFSVGNNFDESRIPQIKKGETTEAELVQIFGQPQNRTVDSEGQTTLMWMYTQANVKGTSFIPIAGAFVGGTDSRTKNLSVILHDGKVKNYTMSGGGMETRGTTQDVPKKN